MTDSAKRPQLAEFSDPATRAAALADPARPPMALERLALDVAERVRAAAAPGLARWKLPKAP